MNAFTNLRQRLFFSPGECRKIASESFEAGRRSGRGEVESYDAAMRADLKIKLMSINRRLEALRVIETVHDLKRDRVIVSVNCPAAMLRPNSLATPFLENLARGLLDRLQAKANRRVDNGDQKSERTEEHD